MTLALRSVFSRAFGIIWASPCSLIGLALLLPLLLLGGRARRVDHTLEAWLPETEAAALRIRRQRFSAITLGHVIIGTSRMELERLRSHERVHVRQYEWLGPLFLVAYPAASLVALARGECAYAGNAFEVHAVRHAARTEGDARCSTT